MRTLRRRARRVRGREARSQIHRPERMFVRTSGKRKVSPSEPSPAVEELDRGFTYVTRERALGILPEEDFRYSTRVKHEGDDEQARSRVMLWEPNPFEYAHLTFARPNLGTFIRYLKRFDTPDWSILDLAQGDLAKALVTIQQREFGGRREHFTWVNIVGFPESVLPSHPGIVSRSRGFRNKENAEIDNMVIAIGRAIAIQEGKDVTPFPCAMFGRGKRLWGDDTAGRVGEACGGRLVLCPESCDDLLIRPLATRTYDRLKSKWETTEMMLGMSWQGRGSQIFMYNLCVDLMPSLGPRVSWWEEPNTPTISAMTETIGLFSRLYEREFGWWVMDIRQQDTSISSSLAHLFFRYAQNGFYTEPGKRARRLGRWISWIEKFHKDTRIALPDGQVWVKHRGNVSGSPLTSLLSTYTGLVAIRTVLHVLFGALADKFVVRVYGDNLLVGGPRPLMRSVPLEAVGEVYSLIFGQSLNMDESYACDHMWFRAGMEERASISFLSKYPMLSGGVWRPTRDTVGSLVAPDAAGYTPNERYARACGLLLDNPFNVEVQELLMRYLDALEDDGVYEGALTRHMEREMTWRLLLEREGLSLTTRVSVSTAQYLYLHTATERREYGTGPKGWEQSLDRWLARVFTVT